MLSRWLPRCSRRHSAKPAHGIKPGILQRGRQTAWLSRNDAVEGRTGILPVPALQGGGQGKMNARLAKPFGVHVGKLADRLEALSLPARQTSVRDFLPHRSVAGTMQLNEGEHSRPGCSSAAPSRRTRTLRPHQTVCTSRARCGPRGRGPLRPGRAAIPIPTASFRLNESDFSHCPRCCGLGGGFIPRRRDRPSARSAAASRARSGATSSATAPPAPGCPARA